MVDKTKYTILIYFLSAVWLANGLFCKVLNLVPRHQQIVAGILGNNEAYLFTMLIGFAEIVMAIWIFTRFKSKLNAIIQMIVVGIMNIIEFILVPDLLLWGRFNIMFAFLFILLIYYIEFNLGKKIKLQIVK